MEKLDIVGCAARYGIRPTTWHRWYLAGLVPKPVADAAGLVWSAGDLAAWEREGLGLCAIYSDNRAENTRLNQGGEWTTTTKLGPEA